MKYRILFICVLCSSVAMAQTTKPKTTTKPATTKSTATKPATGAPVLRNALDSFSYAMGMSLGSFCEQQKITNLNTSLVMKGLNDGGKPGKPLLTEQQMSMAIQGFLQKRKSADAAVVKAAGEKFLADNAKKAGVVTLASGLQYQVLKAGTDTTKPKDTDKVRVHYTGKFTNGVTFESSVESGQPVEFGIHGVITGWTEALKMMTVGSKWRLFVPSYLGYGDNDNGPIPGGSTLVFDVELLEIVK